MTLTEQKEVRRAKIVAHIAASEGGAAFADMMPIFGVAKSCLQRDLQRLKIAGKIVVVIGNRQTLWCTPQRAAQTRKAVKAAADAMAKARRGRKQDARKRAGPRPTSDEAKAGWVAIVAATLAVYPDGLSTKGLSKASGRGIGTVKRGLPLAKAQGLCKSQRFSAREVRWFHRDHWGRLDDLVLFHAAAVRDRRLDHSRKRRGEVVEQAMHDFERQPVHRMVAAANAVPLRKVGPASVWDLAA